MLFRCSSQAPIQESSHNLFGFYAVDDTAKLNEENDSVQYSPPKNQPEKSRILFRMIKSTTQFIHSDER